MRRQLVASGAAVTVAAAVAFAIPAIASHDDEPQLVPDNPDCVDLGYESFGEDGKVEFQGAQPTVIEDITDYFDPEDFDLDIVAVIVKGGNNANVYDEPPFVDLVAPDEKEISHVEICGGELPPPTDEPTEPPTDEPTEPPTDEPTEPAESPAPVPTEVPAGTNTGGSDSLGLWGLIAGSCAAVAGAAVVARRRFLHDS
jgi:hypothetical protein